MLETAPDQTVRRPHAAILPPEPDITTLHPLEMLADRASARLDGCTCTLIAGCSAPTMLVPAMLMPAMLMPAMLMIESVENAGAQAAATWLITIASPTSMRLEVMVDEARLDLLAEGPPDRILTQLVALNQHLIRECNPDLVGR